MNRTANLPTGLESKLSEFRRRVWIVKLAEGLLASVFGLAISYLLVLVLDRFIETPVWLRGFLLVAGAAVMGLGLPLKWHRWVWRQRRLEDAAKLLRWKFPRLGDQLLGIVELAKEQGKATGRSERLVTAAMDQADEAVKDQDLSDAVPQAKHRQWALAALGAVLLTITGFVAINDAARNAFKRWAMPWQDTERYTFARVEPLPNPLVVPIAEPFTLPVALDPSAKWQPSSARGTIQGQPRINADQTDGQFTLSFPPQQQDTELRVKVGDVRETIRVEPRPRPELTALNVRLKLPNYLQYQSEPVIEVRGGAVSILTGSQATFQATTGRALASAEIDGKPAKMDGNRLISETQPVEGESQVTFTWRDELGLTARAPLMLEIKPLEDEAPTIAARRDSLEQVVLDSEVVTFDIDASDDFGIRQVGLGWRGMGEDAPTTEGRKIASAGAPETKEVSARATFCATREGVTPQTLELRAWAEDYLEDRGPSQSAAFVLHVLNKTDHALWVTTQMNKWLEAARETYEREQQLHATNKELRAMSATDLDRPENRRRISQQSSAETANAERLGALNQSGRKLIEHATKNQEFDAPRLESWATLLQSLQDIAANRMPNVSDLLKQSADAKADGKPGQQQQSPDSPNSPTKGENTKSAPQIAEGDQSPKGASKPKPIDPNAPQKEPGPTMSLTESTMNKPDDSAQEEAGDSAPKPPGSSTLTLPSNSVAAAPGQKPKPNEPPSSAQKPLDEAVQAQESLLEEFAKVSDQLAEILASLEASTFVKRLKRASRAQQSLASNVREKTLDAFGVVREPAKDEETEAPVVTEYATIAYTTAKEESGTVRIIKSDMEAYVQRKPDQHFKNVLAEMKKTEVVRELANVGERASENLSGTVIHGSELWADTLDRWAEEMVKAGSCSNCSSCSSDSLPPEIVLKVMQALRDEMALRDETRELENAKPVIEVEDHSERAGKLAEEQERIGKHTESAIEDIVALPEGSQKFGKELQLLGAVVQVMNEASEILKRPDTGAPAIAAETEAIELLLQTKRQGKGGGGGGDSPGGGGGAARASSAALADLGPGSDATSIVQARPVGQATGRAGQVFPEEFKSGLDAYFGNLEGTATP